MNNTITRSPTLGLLLTFDASVVQVVLRPLIHLFGTGGKPTEGFGGSAEKVDEKATGSKFSVLPMVPSLLREEALS
jgi:hypothetical protein